MSSTRGPGPADEVAAGDKAGECAAGYRACDRVPGLPPCLRSARSLPECPTFAKVFGDDFYTTSTFGEGSCFFHSLAAAIVEGYDSIADKAVRKSIGLALRDSMYRFANEQMYCDAVRFVQHRYETVYRHHETRAPPPAQLSSYWEFKERMRDKTVWADLIMISFVAYVFGINLLFWSDKDCEFYYGCDRLDSKTTLRTVFILWKGREHFELIVRITADGTVQRQFHWPKDRLLLERVEAEYTKKQ